jgi:hypothetical protein
MEGGALMPEYRDDRQEAARLALAIQQCGRSIAERRLQCLERG